MQIRKMPGLAPLSTGLLMVVFVLHEGSRAYVPGLLTDGALPTITGTEQPRAFLPLVTISRARRQGDLARIGLRTDGWITTEQTFQTDELGFRNKPGTAKKTIKGMTLGNSYIYGAQLDDDETLAVQLGKRMGTTFYNAGGAFPPEMEWVEGTIQKLGMKSGVVIFGQLERLVPPGKTAVIGPVQGFIDRVRSVDRRWSPVRQAAEEGFRAAHDPRWMQEQVRGSVQEGMLRNGRRVLFLGDEMKAVTTGVGPVEISYWKELQARLRKRNIELVVLIEPAKYSVYWDKLRTPLGPPPGDYGVKLEQALRKASIPVVYPVEVFRAAAAAGEELYWDSDSHWNGRGVEIAAGELAPILVELMER